MKKFIKIVSSAGAALAMSVAPHVAAQSSSCTISNTGPGSNNTCTVDQNHNVTVTCENGVTVANGTVQTANSGNATVSGNTVSGTATSGDANNVNSVATDLAAFCAAAPAAANPPEGGRGGGAPQAAAGAGAAAVASLPNTGADDTVRNVSLAVLAAGAAGAGAHLAVASYRRRALKNL